MSAKKAAARQIYLTESSYTRKAPRPCSEKTKICKRCKEEKPLTSFYSSKHAKRQTRYYQARCKSCANEIRYAYKHFERYSITIEERDAMIAERGGACDLCGGKHHCLNVDHDHDTGEVRGILCLQCNVSLGKLGDSVEGLERALAYLKKHQRGYEESANRNCRESRSRKRSHREADSRSSKTKAK